MYKIVKHESIVFERYYDIWLKITVHDVAYLKTVAEILVGRGGGGRPPPSRKIDEFSEILT
jgi:hypothetical protein